MWTEQRNYELRLCIIYRITCRFSTIVVEKDEYKDGHHDPDQNPPAFSFLAACEQYKLFTDLSDTWY